MTGTEIDFLKDQLARIETDVKELAKNIPFIARDKAEETIARTAFIKPIEKLSVGISLFLVLALAFGSYGKLTSMMDRFERLERKIDESHVVESSEWIQENKKPLSQKITELDKKMGNMEMKIQLINDRTKTLFAR